MANTTRWLVNTSYTTLTLTAADFNSKATGNGGLSTTVVSNSTILDIYGEFSFAITNGGTATTAASYMQLFILPLNQDGTTYGDSTPSGAAAPGLNYLKGNCFVGAQAGAAVLAGTFSGIVLPPSDFKVFLYSQLGASAIAATSAATLKYKGYDENLAV